MRTHTLQDNINYAHTKTLPQAVLVGIGFGAVLAAALFAPNAVQVFAPFLKKGARTNTDRERIRAAIQSLQNRRLIAYEEREGKTYIRVTEKGKRYLREYEIATMKLSVASQWDGKWRMILFDIPERYGRGRRAFQYRIKQLGCFPLQKSVFVYPYDCRDEIDFVAAYFEVGRFINYVIVDDLEKSEGRVRNFFGLLKR